MGRPILFFISRPTSDVITSFRVEPIIILKLVHLDQAASFHPLLSMGLCFLFLVVTVPLHVPIITSMPWALPMSVSQSPRLDPTMISISCSNLVDLFRPLGAIVPKMKLSTAFFLVCSKKNDVEKGWCKQCRINHGADGARAEGPPSRTYFYDNVSW